MGMFNYIDWKAELPNPPKNLHRDWQTKDLGELNMDTYVVSPAGRLYKREYDLYDTGRWYKFEKDADEKIKRVEYAEKPESGESFWDEPSPLMEKVQERHTFVPFTGAFNFYTSGPRNEDVRWIEYVAVFKGGQLSEVFEDPTRTWRMNNLRRRHVGN